MDPKSDFLASAHFPLPSAQEECLEQALSILWQLEERGANDLSNARKTLDAALGPNNWNDALKQKLIVEQNDRLTLSSSGRDQARSIIRRHRLTERLLQDVLELPTNKLDSNACRLEHVITTDVEEAICTLLGHPQSCPHGLTIPESSCCSQAGSTARAIIMPLSQLRAGDEGRISYFKAQQRPELHRLISIGLSPGAQIRLTQSSPACVVSFDGTLVAMEKDVADQIFIRLKGHA